MQWIKLTNRMPNPDKHGWILVYTEGYDFNGEQVFDVKAEPLNECFYSDPDDQPEACRVASRGIPHPSNTGIPNWRDEQKAANALRDLVGALPAGRLIQAYQAGNSVATTAAILLAESPAQQQWDLP